MNPKELMWAIIKRYVSLKNPKTRTELISAKEEEYIIQLIKDALLRQLINES